MLREEENFPANNIRLSQMVPHRIATRQNETLFHIFFISLTFFFHIDNAATLSLILFVVMNSSDWFGWVAGTIFVGYKYISFQNNRNRKTLNCLNMNSILVKNGEYNYQSLQSSKKSESESIHIW